MSSHLFPVRKTGGLTAKFLDVGNHPSIKSCGTCEKDGIIYFMICYDKYIEIQSFIVNENKFSIITKIDMTDTTIFASAILTDGEDIYICYNYGPYTINISMVVINISNIPENVNITDVDSYDIPSSLAPVVGNGIFEDTRKMDWVNDKTIVIPHSQGFYFFDTISNVWSSKINGSTFYSRSYVSVGKSTIMSHWGDSRKISGNTRYPTIFDLTTNSFDSITLPSTYPQVSLFLNGNYYIAQSNYVHIFNEAERVIKKSLPVPITNPCSISHINNRLLFTQKNSDILLIYDLNTETYKRVILPWIMPTQNSSYFHGLIQPTSYMNSLYIPYVTFGIINIDDEERYKFGVIK